MNEFSISIEISSDSHSLEKIDTVIGTPVSSDSLERQEKNGAVSPAVFRLDCGTATEFSDVVESLTKNQKSPMQQIQVVREHGMKAYINIAVFAESAATTIALEMYKSEQTQELAPVST